jgi:hypothetical protein
VTALVFVGERRSQRAIQMCVTWRDGHLAAKTLHDALRAAGLDPEQQRYENLFPDPPLPLVPDEATLRMLRGAVTCGGTLIAMGRLVQRTLAAHDIPFRPMVHPAALGRIRKRALYHAHVAAVVGGRP